MTYQDNPPLDPALEERRRALFNALGANIGDADVVEAMASVRRDLFVPPDIRWEAYDDRALPIGHGQTISQPQIVAVMTSSLRVGRKDRVLDVGTGSGYQAAILALLAREVVSVERVPELATVAARRLEALGYHNVAVHMAGEQLGCPAKGPFDGILVGAAAPGIPQPLIEQLATGGRIVIPVGARDQQYLVRGTRKRGGDIEVERLEPCQFVPLIGRGAWPEEG